MYQVLIRVMRRTVYEDLCEQYENPMENGCDLSLGQTFVSVDGEQPEGFCSEAWLCMEKFVRELAQGGGNFFDGWMKNPYSAMVSCNDGFRPVTFLLQRMERSEKG